MTILATLRQSSVWRGSQRHESPRIEAVGVCDGVEGEATDRGLNGRDKIRRVGVFGACVSLWGVGSKESFYNFYRSGVTRPRPVLSVIFYSPTSAWLKQNQN